MRTKECNKIIIQSDIITDHSLCVSWPLFNKAHDSIKEEKSVEMFDIG